MNNLQLEKVIKNMHAEGLKQILVCAPKSIQYLTGRFIAPGERLVALIIDQSGKAQLIANKLFAQTPLEGAELIEYSDTDDSAKVLANCVNYATLGVDKEFKSRFLLPLMAKRPDIKMVLGSTPVELARMIKTEDELEKMRYSSLLNDRAIEETIMSVRDGMSERELADNYVAASKRIAEGESFESLVCFGKNAAEPHHETGDTRLKRGDAVIIDVGLMYRDYCSDMTRTVFFSEASEEQKYIYELVRQANAAGRAAVRPGVKLKDVDAAARKVISDAGYGQYFIHRTGHNIGLEVHEYPDVSSTSEIICQKGMTFSVEPGIYLPGRFGVRVEDLVEVTNDGCNTMNKLSRELRII